MNSTVSRDLKKLRNSSDVVRIDASITLLHHLHQHITDQDDKELNSVLIRFVRSLGSSTVFARRGFYSTLTVFSRILHNEKTIEKLLSIMNVQLHPVVSNSKNENVDIYMGRILLCGAFIRSKLLIQSTVEVQQSVIELLLNAGRQRSYLSFISVTFLYEFIVQLDAMSMKIIIFPIIEKEFSKPLPEQTLDTFYILLVAREKHPSLFNHKFLKEHLGVKDIITKESMDDIIKLLLSSPRMVSHHPVYKLVCEKLTSSELIADFWKTIDTNFVKPSKNDEYIVIEILRLLLSNVTDETIIPLLLSPNLLQHMLKRFSNCRKNDNDDVLIAFKEVLHLMIQITYDEDVKMETQLNILKKFILYPGDLMIEKKTGIKVIQMIVGNLKFDGIEKLCELYKNIIGNKITKKKSNVKSELWTNTERSYAAQLLTRLIGHPEVLLKQEWRLTQLIFLFNYGLCEVSNVGVDLASQIKDSFYRALDFKLPKLDNVRNLLSSLVHNINSRLRSNTIELKSPLNNITLDAWERVISLIDKLENATRNAEALPIFHTMNLHMGLQLFSDPDMAVMSINELQCCYERIIKNPKEDISITAEEEPHWVEVAVDLLLSLLSRNNHLLRSLVGCVFPHICPYLTSSAVYEILAVLDVKNNCNTLMKGNDESSSVEGNESENNDSDSENVSSSEVSSEDSGSNNEFLDGDETLLTVRLRIALHRALGDAATKTDDEDIDVDQINDDEAKRLDKSLAAAFKILRVNRQIRKKRQEKTDQALTHFRIRVIDLLDVYLETCPSMAIIVDIIVPLFSLLEFCIKDPHQKPLEHRIRTCLRKLVAVKKFHDVTNVNDNLLTTVLKILIKKGERSAPIYQEISDKLAECCTFLVRYMQQANLPIKSVVEIYVENLTAFFKKRDCVLSFLLFKGVLQFCWKGNWQLACSLVDFAFDSNIRYFRRSQALELLLIFYNNNRLQKKHMNVKYEDVRLKLETKLYNNIIHTFQESYDASNNSQSLVCNITNVRKKVQQKFIGLLFTLLRVVHKFHLPYIFDWKNIETILAIYTGRNFLLKDVKSAYKRFKRQLESTVNTSLVKANTELNYSINIATYNSGKQCNTKLTKTNIVKQETSFNYNIQKKKKQMFKKEVYESRAQVTRENLNTCNFSETKSSEKEVNVTGIFQSEELHNKIARSQSSKKRTYKQSNGNRQQIIEKDYEVKRRR